LDALDLYRWNTMGRWFRYSRAPGVVSRVGVRVGPVGEGDGVIRGVTDAVGVRVGVGEGASFVGDGVGATALGS
jgi:hypothetical protein